jgi:hypothetical protein
VLERLAAANWEANDHHRAATALGALMALVGEDAARARCPPEILEGLSPWRSAIAGGQANGYQLHRAS